MEQVLERNPTTARVTYHPLTKTIYRGDIRNADFSRPDNLDPIVTVNFDKELGNGRYDYVNTELYRNAERHIRAGIIDAPSVSTITVTDLIQEVLNKEFREFYAKAGFTPFPVPRLAASIPLGTKYVADKKVPEMAESTLKQEDFTLVTFNLWKNVAHIAASDESSLKANIEPFAYNISQAAGALGKAWNDQCVIEVETLTTAAKGDWGALNANLDYSARNPLDDIQAEYGVIIGNNYIPNTMTMNHRVWNDYASNTSINGYDPATDRQLLGVFPLPKIPGITVIVDPGFTNTVATIYDKRTMLFGEGPTVAEQYRNQQSGFNAYIVRQWGQPLKADNNAGRKMTGVSV